MIKGNDNRDTKKYYGIMSITIELKRPRCHSPKTTRNGKERGGAQNCRCPCRGRQFVGDHQMTCHGCLSGIVHMVKIMLVRGIGIRDVSAALEISVATVLNALKSGKYEIKPKGSRYDRLETDEFWTYVGKKKTKARLIYAYHRESGEIVAYVWGKRGLKTAKKLRKRLKRQGVSYDRMAMDDWGGFVSAFGEDNHSIGKDRTVGIEGSNCRLRHRMRRVFRKTCRFSKKPRNHWKAFNMAFFSINYGFV